MNKATEIHNWRVSMIFSVDLDKIDLTPGSGQLPEEIVMDFNRRNHEMSLTPLSETESVRQYLTTANIRSTASSTSINTLKSRLSWIPSFNLETARATIVERIDSP